MKKSYRILLVDDEESVLRMLMAFFSHNGHQPICAQDGHQAVELFKQQSPDVVLMDIRMPRLSGIDALQMMRKTNKDTPVILMTAYAAVETAVEALRLGAFDYVIKPFELDELKLMVDRAMQLCEMKQEINLLHRALSDSYQWDRILTNSPKMMELCRDTAKIAQSSASVLITGESGTGKELIAKAIHYNSPRAKGPFIKINCGALPESLLESELFGHEKGAFTGAQTQRQGLFERANQGTLLLDEVGEMPHNLQVKLLRVLQEREFERLGGSQTIKTDIRLIAATNRNLAQMVEQGTFRQDLFYRLNVIHLSPIPLRERPEDISLLAQHFLQKFSAENGKEIVELDPSTLAILEAYPWPGNVRELSNAIERAVIMSNGFIIFPDELPEHLQRQQNVPHISETVHTLTGHTLKENLKAYERELICNALNGNQGNRVQTARALGISRRALMYKLQEYEIE
ncbi:acetoacetate metabolism regulatory protein AtoC [Leminorella grimontii]|uniref:Acetoacetate metabolism regulatory protein AtoC n=1 Tax=Leminorella grimontii TaxID=82981 RepID=A0AAV5N4X4_9GAMM|nr:acetoacetate metabolism transcriptional regulator AtoC [Leminorella grimontii]KFC92915.1 acetoacetate metabolism regulatory protein [Leminorella grimontii ATCC 33999 = DSM 5078]GKX56799.1 acetoacetate metabolism regulatory protein AtoC [Leminorella grimontii]GKX60684.1 acetoacetate metabolism regulatory protein AtoC [Leminorella grimontii]VFS62325.1 Transcriptional regulatory protein ZraR [Leminorella grimontii]